MQENRSFDHYFGTLPGVRGFADPDAMTLSHRQLGVPPAGRAATPTATCCRSTSTPAPPAPQATPGLDHAWTHPAPGLEQRRDGPVGSRAKGADHHGLLHPARTSRSTSRWPRPSRSATTTTARCSARPTRTGCTCGPALIDPNGTGGGPITDDSPALQQPDPDLDHLPGAAAARPAISWQVYQEVRQLRRQRAGVFKQFADAPRQLAAVPERACAGRRPAGSSTTRGTTSCRTSPGWSPTRPSPSTRTTPRRPAPTTSRASSTRSPPTRTCGPRPCSSSPTTRTTGCSTTSRRRPPPAGTADEFVDGVPIGAGFRVPAIVVSPWTAGGYVDSDRWTTPR